MDPYIIDKFSECSNDAEDLKNAASYLQHYCGQSDCEKSLEQIQIVEQRMRRLSMHMNMLKLAINKVKVSFETQSQ